MPRVVSPGLSASHNNQTRLCVTTRPFGGTPYSPPSGLSLRSSEQWLEISATWAQNTGTKVAHVGDRGYHVLPRVQWDSELCPSGN